MIKRGMVIRTCGDADIANAIASGMAMAAPDTADPEYVRMAIKEARDRRYWQEMIDTAEVLYGRSKPPGAFSRAFWGGIGLVVYQADRLLKRLSEADRGGMAQ